MMELTTQELLERIHCAARDELNEIISAVTERFRELWPEWDLLTISVVGRTPADHIKTLEQSIRLLDAAAKGNDKGRKTPMV